MVLPWEEVEELLRAGDWGISQWPLPPEEAVGRGLKGEENEGGWKWAWLIGLAGPPDPLLCKLPDSHEPNSVTDFQSPLCHRIVLLGRKFVKGFSGKIAQEDEALRLAQIVDSRAMVLDWQRKWIIGGGIQKEKFCRQPHIQETRIILETQLMIKTARRLSETTFWAFDSRLPSNVWSEILILC